MRRGIDLMTITPPNPVPVNNAVLLATIERLIRFLGYIVVFISALATVLDKLSNLFK